MNRLYLLLAAALSISGCASDVDETLGLPPLPPSLGAPVARIGRPLTGSVLAGGLAAGEARERRVAQFERAAPADWLRFSADIERALAVFDGFDRRCGNQWLAGRSGPAAARYRALVTLLADDRLRIDGRSTVCDRFLAVELDALGGAGPPSGDCGGRSPNVDAVGVLRSLLVFGKAVAGDDRDRGDRGRSTADFPFLVGR